MKAYIFMYASNIQSQGKEFDLLAVKPEKEPNTRFASIMYLVSYLLEAKVRGVSVVP
jgi:hypothetical protein